MSPRAVGRIFGLAAAPFIVGCFAGNYDFKDDVYTGAEARTRILDAVQPRAAGNGEFLLPRSAKNFYIFDGGTFNGSITYWSFECDTIEDCWKSLESIGLSESDFRQWEPSAYAVVMQGPAYYSTELATSLWDVTGIRKGKVYEHVEDDRRMVYCAVDIDRRRIYHHYESGGFPTDRAEASPAAPWSN